MMHARYVHCAKCRTVFDVRRATYVSGDTVRCPKCGSSEIEGAGRFVAEYLECLKRLIAEAEDVVRELETRIESLDRLFSKLLTARRSGILLQRELDDKLLDVYAVFDELVVRAADAIKELGEEMKRRHKNLKDAIIESGLASLDEFFPLTNDSSVKREIDAIKEELKRRERILDELRGSIENVLSFSDISKLLEDGEVLLEVFEDEGRFLLVTDRRVCDANARRLKLLSCVALNEIVDITKPVLRRGLVIHLMDGRKVKLSFRYSDTVKRKVLQIAFEGERGLNYDAEKLREVAAPELSTLINALADLKKLAIKLASDMARLLSA